MKDCRDCNFVRSHTEPELREVFWSCSKGLLPAAGVAGTRLFGSDVAYNDAALTRYWTNRIWCIHWKEYWLTKMVPLAFSALALAVSVVTLALRLFVEQQAPSISQVVCVAPSAATVPPPIAAPAREVKAGSAGAEAAGAGSR